MTTLPGWISARGHVDTSARGAAAYARILDKPSLIVLVRNDTDRPVQQFRIEYASTQPSTTEGGAGQSAQQIAIVFGVRGVTGVTDADIVREDRFAADGKVWRVVAVTVFPGEIQARCEALS
jgi:hypothetical protein